MRLLTISLVTFFLALQASAQISLDPAAAPAAASTSTSLDRVIDAAITSSQWPRVRSQADRLDILRDKALKHPAKATPISDRYVITVLGGPVDLVHFFGLARIVCAGQPRRAALAKEWEREGGPQALIRRADEVVADCTPEDLPSNALGALFGEEMRRANADLSHDLVASLRAFFAKLEVVPDAVIQNQSYERLILGVTPLSTSEQQIASRHWFSAQPLYMVPVVAPERAGSIPDAAAALKAAGLELRNQDGQPIILERLDGGPSGPVKAVSVDEPSASRKKPAQAVPVE